MLQAIKNLFLHFVKTQVEMQQNYIQDFDQIEDGQTVTVKGWIAKIRNSKTNHFFDFRDGTGFTQCVVSLDAVGEGQFAEAKRFTLESSVSFTGKLLRNERSLGGFEIQVASFQLHHLADGFPITKEDKEHGVNFLEERRHLWLRRKRQWAIMRVRNQLIQGIHEFFQNEGFVQMDAPFMTGSACEGTTDLFATDFFGDTAYLSQSGQLYGEAMAMAMGKIYTFGPTFRSEKSDTPRHLSEFWMIEPEVAYATNEDNMDTIERFVKHVIGRALERCQAELEILERDTTSLQQVVSEGFPRVSYSDSVKILNGTMEVNGKNAITLQQEDLAAAKALIETNQKDIEERQKAIKAGMKKGARKHNEAKIIALQTEIKTAEEKVRNIPRWIESAQNFQHGEDFGGSDETVLTRVFSLPVMVYNWPTKIKAFYMKEVDGQPEFVKGVDLLAPEGFGEVIGGSERETDINILVRKIEEHELDQADFEWYLDLRRFGSVPHSGFGLGLERLVRWTCNLHHVRETIPFPRRYGHIRP
jgi:asparaginyl-tRNA synthetase